MKSPTPNMNSLWLLCIALLPAACFPTDTSAQENGDSILPYAARYAVYRNGKLSARAEVSLERQSDGWIIKSETVGTHGMARLMKFRDYEFVEGFASNGRIIPLRYEHELSWIGPDQETIADFGWDAMEVMVSDDGNEVTLQLVEDAVDPMSLQVELRRRLAQGSADLSFMLVEEDEIEQQLFRALAEERMETSLGCLKTTPVEKVRDPSSRRFTRSWHAEVLSYIPVRIEHGKRDGDRMEMRITELELDGSPFEPLPGCAAEQSGESR